MRNIKGERRNDRKKMSQPGMMEGYRKDDNEGWAPHTNTRTHTADKEPLNKHKWHVYTLLFGCVHVQMCLHSCVTLQGSVSRTLPDLIENLTEQSPSGGTFRFHYRLISIRSGRPRRESSDGITMATGPHWPDTGEIIHPDVFLHQTWTDLWEIAKVQSGCHFISEGKFSIFKTIY